MVSCLTFSAATFACPISRRSCAPPRLLDGADEVLVVHGVGAGSGGGGPIIAPGGPTTACHFGSEMGSGFTVHHNSGGVGGGGGVGAGQAVDALAGQAVDALAGQAVVDALACGTCC